MAQYAFSTRAPQIDHYYADAWSETEIKALVYSLFTFTAITATGPLIAKRNIRKQLLLLLAHKLKQHFSDQVKQEVDLTLPATLSREL